MTLDEVLTKVVKAEGGFVNNIHDSGGATNFGVTKKTLENWYGRPVSIQEVKDLPLSVAKEIFKTNYFIIPKIDKLPNQLWHIMLDTAVLFGSARAIEFLQKSLVKLGYPTKIDSIIGPKTIQLASQCNKASLISAIVDQRIVYHKQRVLNNPSQKVFLQGWLNRAESLRYGG